LVVSLWFDNLNQNIAEDSRITQGIADRLGVRNRKIAAQHRLRAIWPNADHSAPFH
jgi:hypothetical protein